MAGISIWLRENWFLLLQGIGIVFGLVFAGLSFRRDAKARQTSDLLALTQQHRELWSELHRRAELGRILSEDADLLQRPISPAEQQFLNLATVHFYTGYLLAKRGSLPLLPIDAVAADVRGFFNLPIPKFFWRGARSVRDPDFVKFVDDCLGSPVP